MTKGVKMTKGVSVFLFFGAAALVTLIGGIVCAELGAIELGKQILLAAPFSSTVALGCLLYVL